MYKVGGAAPESARDFFDHTHISFEPRPFSDQRDCEARGFLAVERAVSQVEHTIWLFIHEVS